MGANGSGTTGIIALAGLIVVAVAAAPAPVSGQFAQYTQPGTVSRGGPEVTRDGFEQALEEAPWRLGPIRLDPWIGLSNLRLTANPLGIPEEEESEPEGDLTASGGAGLRAHLPTGHNVYWTAHALPEYVWWADQGDRNRVNGRYGAGVFAFFNRLTLELSGRRQEELGIVSAELPREVNSRRDTFRLGAETRLGFALSLFVEASEARTRNVLEEAERAAAGRLQALDRDERSLRGGLRYRPRERWTLGVGMEWTESDSVSGERDLSSSGTAPVVEVRYTGPKFWVSAGAELRSLESQAGSRFQDSDTETYSVTLGLDGNRLSPSVYARKSLSLALSEGFSHFTTETFGASLGLPLGHRLQVRAYGEIGESEFVPVEAGVPDRVSRADDLTSYGAEITFRLGRYLSTHLGGHVTELDSNVPGEDRDLEVLRTGISLGLGGGEGSGGGWI